MFIGPEERRGEENSFVLFVLGFSLILPRPPCLFFLELMVDTCQESVQPEEEEEEEYVVLDLESISHHIAIPLDAPYLLSALDTPNPILLIDNKLKLIGEYEETIGTCLVFTQNDGNPIVHEDARQTKQINPMAKLNKILKFRPYLEPSQ